MIRIVCCLFVFLITQELEAARILAVFPTPSISHQIVFRPYTQELARRGHDVTVITTDPAFPKGATPENLTEIDFHEMSYKIWRKEFTTLVQGKKDDMFFQMETAFKLLNVIVEKQLETEEFKKILSDKNQKFDLIISEACARPSLILSHVFKAPVIQFSSFGSMVNSYEVMGYPSHPFLYPGTLHQRLYNLSFWEKLTQLYWHYSVLNMYSEVEKDENAMFKRQFGADAPGIKDLNKNVHMLFINVHPIWEDNRPVPPGVVNVGGIHQKPKQDLPKELKSYLDSSKSGVIYMSFGTNVDPSLLSPDKIQAFINVFSQLPYDILWKWDMDELPGRTENIKISKWLPQADLLRHPKIKLFITQGGLQSTDEALAGGVPLIGVPMLGDQWYNVEKYVYHNIGLQLDIETMTQEKLKNAINTIVNDDRYRQNVVKLRQLMMDTPVKPLDTAVWWTEYVLRHKGATQLRSPAANMSWCEYYEVVFVLKLLALAAAFILISFYLVLAVVRFFTTSQKLKKH